MKQALSTLPDIAAKPHAMPTSSTRKRCARTRAPTAEQWQKRKSEIQQLYIDENKSLKEVQIILRKRHQFTAT